MRLYNAESGFEEYQAEEDLKAFAHFTMGADDADSKKHGYGLVECYRRLPTTRLLLPPDLLKGQTRLLLNKLPDTMPEKRAVLKTFFQESRSGVPRWETLHAVIKAVALMLVPDAPFAPVVNAVSRRAAAGSALLPPTPLAIAPRRAPSAPSSSARVNPGPARAPRTKHPLTAHAGESRSEEEINIAEFELEQEQYPQAKSAVCSDNFEVNFVPRAHTSIYENNDETDGVADVSCADGAPMHALWGAVAHDALMGLV